MKRLESANSNLKDHLIHRTREVWQPRLGRDVGHEDARQIAANFVGFFSVLAEWSRWGAHWGEPVHVRTPAGAVEGIAQRLDPDGGLVLRVDTGAETVVLAGDLVAPPEGRPAA